MARVVSDPVALDDLEEIARYIERDSPPAAKRFVQRIFARVEQLTQSPLSGGVIEEDRRRIYRQLLQGNYHLIYRTDHEVASIVAVYHAARQLSEERIP